MDRNRLLRAGLATAGLLILGACAAGRKDPAPAPPGAASEAGLEGRGDSAATLDAMLRRLDTAAVPSRQASELYLLALDNFLAMAPEDPRVPEVKLWKANHLYNQKAYDEAVRAYLDLMERHPHSPHRVEANVMIAQAYERLEKPETAEEWYRRMLSDTNQAMRRQAEERIVQAIYLQGETQQKSGDVRRAEEAYARVAVQYPRSSLAPIALYNAGVMAERRKAWPDAIAHYNRFFDVYFASEQLPRVLFREAKCRELNGEFALAGEKYRNLAKAHPRSREAEPALYNAGFAFASAGKPEPAAEAFEEYARLYPDMPEAPNLLSRAAETYGALKAWDKVAALQTEFARRYGGSKARMVQALGMAGLAEMQQGREEEARKKLKEALAEYARLQQPDATARYYAAQSRAALGDLEAARMRAVELRPGNPGNGLKAKRDYLRAATEHYLLAMEMKIVDWVVRAGFGMAQAFRQYGEQAAAALSAGGASPSTRLEGEEAALSELVSAYAKAMPQYLRVLQVAQRQNVNNREVEEARKAIPEALETVLKRLGSLDSALLAAMPARGGSLEEALSTRLQRTQRAYQAHAQALDWADPVLGAAANLDSAGLALSKAGYLQRYAVMGKRFQAVVDAARQAPAPAGYDSVQTFFYLAKVVQELIPSVEARTAEVQTEGIQFALQHGLQDHPLLTQLREDLGQGLFATAHCLDFLAQRALTRPPTPAGLTPAQRKPFERRFEELGYALQEQAVKTQRRLVGKAKLGQASTDWAARAFAALLRVEPDRWQTPPGEGETEASWRYPWDSKPVTEAELESLRNLPFSLPNFGT